MNWHNNPFTALAARARQGEADAVREFRQQLSRQVESEARGVLRRGKAISPLGRRILSEAERILARKPNDLFPHSEPIVREVVSNLCDEILDRLCNPGFSSRETRLVPGKSVPAAEETFRCAS
jgi:hypothetical protein